GCAGRISPQAVTVPGGRRAHERARVLSCHGAVEDTAITDTLTRARPRARRRPARRLRTSTVLIGLGALVVAGFLVLIAQGSVRIPITEVVRILLGGEPSRAVHRTIVIDARLPKALAA